MKIIHKIKDMFEYSDDARKNGKTIGFVPTMGYFHEGHLSLMREAKKTCDVVVVSIFVNPIQFGANEDFNDYPVDLERDVRMIKEIEVDVVFNPGIKEMYAAGYNTFINLEGHIVNTLCGKKRKGHFKGVATVVSKLFNIVSPHKAFFGQKDAQQCVVIKKMVKDLNINTEVVVLPTIREKDGLAMSSRNSYLTARERKVAPVLYKALQMAHHMIELGEKDSLKIIKEVKEKLSKHQLIEIEYISVVNPETLDDIKVIAGRILMAIAIRLGKTRLIDNIIVEP